jgi:crotonobetainyl-CoA:carnitine CoA-transferase CaiB-like acyl-CoA transferase
VNHLREAPAGSAQHREVDSAAPLSGIRVLDFTRVIAGPVATRALALLGADVLRIDPPGLPELPVQQEETGAGKFTALLDLATGAGLDRANELLQTADILVTGYRPGSLERFGLRYPPGLVVARVAAWGSTGPWAGRRGFDSIVQAASGIAMVEGDGGRPGVLPVQALDHASGYLLAAAALDALRSRDSDGHGRDVTVSLAGTAHWLLHAEGRIEQKRDARWPGEQTTVVHGGSETARPALREYDDYAWPAHPSGTDPAAWQ